MAKHQKYVVTKRFDLMFEKTITAPSLDDALDFAKNATLSDFEADEVIAEEVLPGTGVHEVTEDDD